MENTILYRNLKTSNYEKIYALLEENVGDREDRAIRSYAHAQLMNSISYISISINKHMIHLLLPVTVTCSLYEYSVKRDLSLIYKWHSICLELSQIKYITKLHTLL